MNHIFRVAMSIVLASALVFAVASCENKSAKARELASKELASKAAESFHQQFNVPQDRDLLIVNAASEHPEFVAYLHSVYVRDTRAKLGLFQSATEKSCTTTYQPAGTSIHLVLNSQFERGAATEKFSYLVTGTSAELIGYSIEPPLLSAQ